MTIECFPLIDFLKINGEHGHDQKEESGQKEGLETGVDRRAENPIPTPCHRRQGVLEPWPEPARQEEKRHEHIGKPRLENAHICRHPLVCLEFEAFPFGGPRVLRREIPGVSRPEKTAFCRRDDDDQAKKGTYQRGKFRPQEYAGQGVGNGEAQSGEKGEGKDR